MAGGKEMAEYCDERDLWPTCDRCGQYIMGGCSCPEWEFLN